MRHRFFGHTYGIHNKDFRIAKCFHPYMIKNKHGTCKFALIQNEKVWCLKQDKGCNIINNECKEKLKKSENKCQYQ